MKTWSYVIGTTVQYLFVFQRVPVNLGDDIEYDDCLRTVINLNDNEVIFVGREMITNFGCTMLDPGGAGYKYAPDAVVEEIDRMAKRDKERDEWRKEEAEQRLLLNTDDEDLPF